MPSRRSTVRAPSRWIGSDPSLDEKERSPLSRARVVRAALRFADQHGIAALTMRALAADLGASPMALYNHVRDKEELLDLVLDLMLGEVDTARVPGDWVAQMKALVTSYHRVLGSHPGFARIYGEGVRVGPNGLRLIDRALEILLGAGFSPSESAGAFSALYTYAVGFHQVARVKPAGGAVEVAVAPVASYAAALPAEEIPSLTRVGPHLTGGEFDRFDYGLDLLLAGLAARLPAATGPGR